MRAARWVLVVSALAVVAACARWRAGWSVSGRRVVCAGDRRTVRPAGGVVGAENPIHVL